MSSAMKLGRQLARLPSLASSTKAAKRSGAFSLSLDVNLFRLDFHISINISLDMSSSLW